MKALTVYTAASFRLLHAVRLFHDALRAHIPDVRILDWTGMGMPPPGLTPEKRRRWFDTEQQGGQVYRFCRDACASADVVVYLGHSGQDAGVEVGLAAGAGVPVIGVAGPLEAPGLMLHGAVNLWCYDIQEAVSLLSRLAGDCGGVACDACKVSALCDGEGKE
ncbi:translation initiation factor 2 [uncultured Desulfovibrio sp.]|mgnify:CR=1 FL=1|uniref:translation initiation factor 2 n=1 Tax=uncultured Desulfovibrio sp. TaxID=167968 RepID=UPI00259007E2|nr:translation initiation factor 2 [uncultured Desulfovibrio sp.]